MTSLLAPPFLVVVDQLWQAYCAKWLLDASPLGGRIIKVRPRPSDVTPHEA